MAMKVFGRLTLVRCIDYYKKRKEPSVIFFNAGGLVK